MAPSIQKGLFGTKGPVRESQDKLLLDSKHQLMRHPRKEKAWSE